MIPSTTPVSELRNIGPTVATHLSSIGINTRGELAKIGAAKAYQKLCRKYPDRTMPVCYYLYSLEAALKNKHWDDLPVTIKKQLCEQAAQ